MYLTSYDHQRSNGNISYLCASSVLEKFDQKRRTDKMRRRKKERERNMAKGGGRGTAGEEAWGPPTVWWADASLQQSRRDRCLPPRTIALFLPPRFCAHPRPQPDGCNFGQCVSAANRATRCADEARCAERERLPPSFLPRQQNVQFRCANSRGGSSHLGAVGNTTVTAAVHWNFSSAGIGGEKLAHTSNRPSLS